MRQPWAWAIIHGGKDVENRTRNVAGSYRGPVAIHAGLSWDEHGIASPVVHRAALEVDPVTPAVYRFNGKTWRHEPTLVRGAFIGIADLVDVHEGVCDTDTTQHGTCCMSPWAEFPYLGRGDGRGVRPYGHHLVLANPRPLEVPIPARGKLGLWTPSAEVLEQLQAACDIGSKDFQANVTPGVTR